MPQAQPLTAGVIACALSHVAAIIEHVLEELIPLACEAVGDFGGFPLREDAAVFPFIDVRAAALDEVLGKLLAQRFLIASASAGELGELGLEQGQQAVEGFLIAAMRGGGEQHKMAIGIGGKFAQQFEALLARLTSADTGMRFVDDDELGAGADEVVTVPVGLDVIKADHGEGVSMEDRIADR